MKLTNPVSMSTSMFDFCRFLVCPKIGVQINNSELPFESNVSNWCNTLLWILDASSYKLFKLSVLVRVVNREVSNGWFDLKWFFICANVSKSLSAVNKIVFCYFHIESCLLNVCYGKYGLSQLNRHLKCSSVKIDRHFCMMT